MSPVTAAMIEPLIIREDDEWCVAMKKLQEAEYKFYLWIRYCFPESGQITTQDATAQWGTDICQTIDCSEEP